MVNTPTAAAAAAAYARAIEGATEATKSSSAKYYPHRQEVRGSHGYHRQLTDTRDQPIEVYNREEMDYRLTTGKIHTIPESEEIYDQDVEARNLLESILHLDTEVTEAAAAVYHYFETKTVDDEISPSDRAEEVIHSIKQHLLNGNSQPAYQFLETAKSVLPILLEEREEVGLQLEANIFKDIDEELRTPANTVPIDLSSPRDDLRSISEQSQAIFQILSQSEDVVATNHFKDMDSDFDSFRILEERPREGIPDYTPDGIYDSDPADMEDPSQFNATNVDEMDLEFVENFDLAYSEFLFYHPKLVAKNPTLLKNLRIYKLQKFLEYNDTLERANLGKLHVAFEEKRAMEESMQVELKEAVRKKAAHEILLQSEVNDINWNTKKAQAQLRWKIFRLSEDRAKRQSKLREQFKQIARGKTRQDLIKLIPEGPHSAKLETAIKASFIAEGSSKPEEMTPKKLDQLRKLQVENSVINSEMLIVSQKLDRLREEAQKLEWVQSTLAELDPVAVHKFKKRFEKAEKVKL